MGFQRTEEQELLIESLNAVLTKVATDEYIRECDLAQKRPVKVVQALKDNGFLSLGIPEEFGGTPCDLATLSMVSEEIARHGISMNLFSSALQLHNVLHCGTKEQIKMTADAIINGMDNAYSLGFTEPGSGSDSASLQTTYTRKNGKVYINGHKTFITGGVECRYMLCMARNADATDPKKAFTMWWIDMKKLGIKIEPISKMGWWMRSNCDVYLENVELEEKDLFGTEGNGFLQLMDNFEVERLQVCSVMLGSAQCAFEDAARYANQRMQFGKPIATFQLTQEKITYMAIKLTNMRNMIYTSLNEKMKGKSQQIEAALCKLYCAQSANEVIDDAMQIMGGIGITNDLRVSRLWRDTRIYRLAAGSDEIMIHIAGRGLLKKYK